MSSTDATSRDTKGKAELPSKSSFSKDIGKESNMPATASYTATAAYKSDSYDYSFTDPLASPSPPQTNTRHETPLPSQPNQASYSQSQSQSFFPDSPPTKAPSAVTPALLPDQGASKYSAGKQADERIPIATASAVGTDTATKIQLDTALQRLESLER